MEANSKCDDDAAARRRKHRQQEGDNLERRAARAEMLVALGELSFARQALEGEEVAPGTRDTLEKLKDETKRRPFPRDPLPPEILNFSPRVPFSFDSGKFLKKSGQPRGVQQGGASGMTVEHLRPLLDLIKDQQLFCKVAERLARADVPPNC